MTVVMSRRAIFILGSFFFAGCAPRLRGTVATLVASALFGLVERTLAPAWWWTLPAAAAVLGAGIPLGSAAEREFGKKDPQWFVLDEVLGVLVAGTGLTALTGRGPWAAALAVFFFFRLFDGLKPPPIRWVDRRVPGGLGIMLDDLLAAIAAWPLAAGALILVGRI